MSNKGKTQQFLAYLCKNYGPATVTSLMKLSYLIDLIAAGRLGQQITSFKYMRYYYGPFDKSIYSYLEDLTRDSVLMEKTESAQYEEYILYMNNPERATLSYDKITKKEINIIHEVLTTVRGLGAKALTEIAYKTKPMKAIGAEIGNKKGLGLPLDLNAK